VLTNFDVFANAGYKKALSKSFAATANSSGQVVIAFTQAGPDNPFVSGIEILSQFGSTATSTPTRTSTAIIVPTNTPTSTSTSTATCGVCGAVVAINAGGGATGSYVADADFNAGNQYTDTSTAIDTSGGLDANPAPQGVYQTVRWNTAFTYTIPSLVANTNYTVRLHWAELSWQAAGQRVFNVAINGVSALSNFDVFANAGYKKAISKTFTTMANSSGQIVIAFTQGGADNPFISGIEIVSPSGSTLTPTIASTSTSTATSTTTSTGVVVPPIPQRLPKR